MNGNWPSGDDALAMDRDTLAQELLRVRASVDSKSAMRASPATPPT
jgi:hypothetical protein